MPNSWTVSEKVIIGNERIQESYQLGNGQRSRWCTALDGHGSFSAAITCTSWLPAFGLLSSGVRIVARILRS